jgi:serine/threonine-protein phosphatase 6 regulatory ankyrin repeat subunit B
MWAVHLNDVEAAKALIKAGANVKATNALGASALSEAAALGSAPLVKVLLDAGADAKTLTTADGETVLMTAARAGNVEAVKLLADGGADVNAREKYRGQTALMWASAEGHGEVVKLLMARGADWKAKSEEHSTARLKMGDAASSVTPMPKAALNALSYAARSGSVPALQALLDGGADINLGDGEDSSPIIIALMNKEYTAAKYLLDRGADVNLQDSFGRAALFAAVDIRNEDYSAMPRRMATDPMPSLEIVKAILAKKPNVNATLKRAMPGRSGMDLGDSAMGAGATALHRAARAGDADVTKLLLEAGADASLKTTGGATPLLFAAGIGYRDKNTTGTEEGAVATLKLLVAAGQDLKQTNPGGETALHGAATRGADLIVQYLVDQKLDINARSSRGQTPLDVALGKGSFGLPTPHPTTVALLQKLGAKESTDLPPLPGGAGAGAAKGKGGFGPPGGGAGKGKGGPPAAGKGKGGPPVQ